METISGGINWSFILNYFWSSHSPRWSKGTCSKSRQVCEWLGKPEHTKPKAVVTELQPKNWNWCIPSRYWWSKNPGWTRAFCSITCKAELCQIWDLHRKTENCKVFHFLLLPAKQWMTELMMTKSNVRIDENSRKLC